MARLTALSQTGNEVISSTGVPDAYNVRGWCMRIGFISAFAALLGLLILAPQSAVSQDTSTASTLEVHVTYMGSGTVDEKHKVYLVLWDSPAFVSGQAMPMELQLSSQ